MVAPLVGVWIEIMGCWVTAYARARVAPLVGVWIEILFSILKMIRIKVAPLVGVWIEIIGLLDNKSTLSSLPSWECGLKSRYNQ